jgi:hypothetical protein
MRTILTIFPLKVEQHVNDILIVTLALTNNSTVDATYYCNVADTAGNTYSHSTSSLTPTDEYLFARHLTPGTTQLGNEDYWFLPNDGKSLTLDCYVTKPPGPLFGIHLTMPIN